MSPGKLNGPIDEIVEPKPSTHAEDYDAESSARSGSEPIDIPLFSNWLEAIARELRNGDLSKAIEQTTAWLGSAKGAL